MIEYRISSFCSLGSCVEVGRRPDGRVSVRDTKDPRRTDSLELSGAQWSTFLTGLKVGAFDPA